MPQKMIEKDTGLTRIFKAALYSYKGFVSAFRHEASFRQEVIFAIVLIPLAFWLNVSKLERVAMVGVVIVVLIVELLNTAIEASIDRIGPEWHVLSKRAKDMGSAAVFLSLLLCGSIWAAALYQRFGA